MSTGETAGPVFSSFDECNFFKSRLTSSGGHTDIDWDALFAHWEAEAEEEFRSNGREGVSSQ